MGKQGECAAASLFPKNQRVLQEGEPHLGGQQESQHPCWSSRGPGGPSGWS